MHRDEERTLAVVDATLAGRPVASDDATLARLCRDLVDVRPELGADAAAQMDARVAPRLAPAPAATAPGRLRRLRGRLPRTTQRAQRARRARPATAAHR